MFWFKNTAFMVLSLLALTLSTSSCGKKDNGNNSGSATPGATSVTQYTPGGPATISFTGQDNYLNAVVFSAGMLLTSQNYFVDPGYGAWPFVNNSRTGGPGSVTIAPTIPASGGSTFYGRSGIDPNNTLVVTVTPGKDLLHANVQSGMLTLSAQTVQRFFGGNMPSVIGLTIDVGVNGTTLVAGGILIYTSIDQAGQYHGKFLAF